ncbi:MAG TPA: metal ABC transporter permease [Syntrophales bacterium]|nr:metal ABC transporter permease [Syntrophales bacterium]HQB31653.1 metal ABC transporter permease [Syntrophales bacterium]
MTDLLSYEFMRNALAASILASILCGVIGPFVVTRKMVFAGGSMSHSAFGGMGIACWLGLNPLAGALAFTVLAALFLSAAGRRSTEENDLLIGVLWAVGMALGIVFIHITPGYVPDLMSFLFGNILLVPRGDLVLAAVLTAVVTVSVIVFFRGFVSIALDEEFARSRKMPVKGLHTGLLVLVALAIVTLIQVVGIILVLALLTIPVAVAREFTIRFTRLMILSSVTGILLCIGGLAVSFTMNLPSGAAIILLGALLLGAVKAFRFIRK